MSLVLKPETAIESPMQALLPPEEQPWPIQMKFVYGVETDYIQAGAKPNHLAFVAGSHDSPNIQKVLDSEFILTTLVSKNLIKFREGDKITRAYRGGKSQDAFDAFKKRADEVYVNNQGKTEKCMQEGYAYVCAILQGNECTLSIFETTKTAGPYFFSPVAVRADFGADEQKHGIKVDIFDHTENMTKSKAGFFYLNKNLFKQYEQVVLTKDQIDLVYAAYKAKAKFVDNLKGA